MKNKTLLMLLIIASCHVRKYDTSEHQQTVDDTAAKMQVKDAKAFAAIKKDNIDLKENVTDTVTAVLRIDSIGQHPFITIPCIKGKQIHALISSDDPKANIRINQLQMPDSTFDGPFGRTLDYPLKQTGTYAIIIGEDMMAGERWNGALQIKAWIK